MKLTVYLKDRYHSEDDFLNVFVCSLGELCHAVRIERNLRIETLVRERPELVVIARHNSNDDGTTWLKEKDIEQLAEYVRSGGRLFVWHSGLAGYPPSYTELVGGRFVFHPKKTSVRYFKVDGSSFEIVDEHYIVELRKGVEVFLWSESSCGRSTAGWRKRFGEGKILALTPAHEKEGLENEKFKLLLKESLAWLLEKL